jgi:hypothetical protein
MIYYPLFQVALKAITKRKTTGRSKTNIDGLIENRIFIYYNIKLI